MYSVETGRQVFRRGPVVARSVNVVGRSVAERGLRRRSVDVIVTRVQAVSRLVLCTHRRSVIVVHRK